MKIAYIISLCLLVSVILYKFYTGQFVYILNINGTEVIRFWK